MSSHEGIGGFSLGGCFFPNISDPASLSIEAASGCCHPVANSTMGGFKAGKGNAEGRDVHCRKQAAQLLNCIC